MIAKLSLTIGDRTERMYIPTRDAHDNRLEDDTVISLLRVAVVDLYYIVDGALDEQGLEPALTEEDRLEDLCICGHKRAWHRPAGGCVVAGCSCPCFVELSIARSDL